MIHYMLHVCAAGIAEAGVGTATTEAGGDQGAGEERERAAVQMWAGKPL